MRRQMRRSQVDATARVSRRRRATRLLARLPLRAVARRCAACHSWSAFSTLHRSQTGQCQESESSRSAPPSASRARVAPAARARLLRLERDKGLATLDFDLGNLPRGRETTAEPNDSGHLTRNVAHARSHRFTHRMVQRWLDGHRSRRAAVESVVDTNRRSEYIRVYV